MNGWPTGQENILRFGSTNGPIVVGALPLFEEGNRTRAFLVAILRAVAARGIDSALPDVPGQGESVAPLASIWLTDMCAAYASALKHLSAGRRPVFMVAIRSGALLDSLGHASGHWSLSPQDGVELARDLRRSLNIGLPRSEKLTEFPYVDPEFDRSVRAPVRIAGSSIAPGLLSELQNSHFWPRHPEPHEDPEHFTYPGRRLRIVRLMGDPRVADHYVDGEQLWSRAEPSNDLALADGLADDISTWVRSCAAS